MSVELKGMQAILNKLAEYTKEYPGALGAALYQEAESVMARSVQLCPVDTSALLTSRFVSRPAEDSLGISVRLGYGKTYAIYVHEMPSTVNWTKPGSGNKFLVRAIDEKRKGYLNRLVKRTDRNIKTGVGMDVRGTEPEVPRT